MNNGFYSFPSPKSDSTIVDIKEFDSSGTYVIPDGARRLWITLWGAGSGGGGGARQGTGVAAYGGGGGGGGMVNMAYYFVESLGLAGESYAAGSPTVRGGSRGKTLTVVIGAGGSGGNGGASDTSSGSDGGRGGDSWVSVTGFTFSANGMISAYGGANYTNPFGRGGSTTSGSGGTPASASNGALINGVPSAQTLTTYSWNGTNSAITTLTAQTVYSIGNNGGTAGGGISTGNAGQAGGNIAYGTAQTITVVSNPLLSTAGAAIIKTGGAANSAAPPFNPIGIHAAYSNGFGGVGGGAGTSTSGANGENGWRGGGGGGGGASRNGQTAGNGGSGGNGYCLIVALR